MIYLVPMTMTAIVSTSHHGLMMGLVVSSGDKKRRQPADKTPMIHQKSAYSLRYFVMAER